MTDDIKLPPLPPLHIVPSVEPVDYPEVAQALMDYARAAIQADRARRALLAERDALAADFLKVWNDLQATKIALAAAQPAADKFVATFRCESNGIVGSMNAPIHSVSMHDDGVIEVVIDHWPEQQPAPVEENSND